MAGGQIDIRVEPDVKDFPAKLEGGLAGALGTATKIGSALGLALGAGTAAKAVMDVGLSFDKQMNTMSAVSQGTAAQMDAVAARARELGNDTDLTATSASDAAAAMVELAKGGFTVEQSMEAAKGTLQLAAAAQIDAASAATIQSQALQSFSLGAEDAARVSDILAGAANASSAEIEGIAQGLQQSGTVANQFGVSIDDTATALAMFANAGIQGSDAGTLLKSALLALTDQGNPAQGAIEELGLSVYDLQGNFVGLPALFDQLKDAQANMTPEAYQAATATLFGSDAMRLAGIAAEQGGEGFEELRDKVTRSGQAAEVAAAQTQGLPGALERAQNAAEDLGLKVYDAVKGPLTDAANSGVDAMENLGPAIESAASMGASAFSGLMGIVTPAIGVFTDLAGVVMGLPAPLLAMGAAIPLAKMSGLTGALSTGGGALKIFGTEMMNSGRAAKDFKTYFDETGRSISTFDGLMMAAGSSTNKTLSQMGRAYTQAGTQMRANGRLAKEVAKEHTGLSRVLGTAGGSLKTFGGTAAGVANGGMSLLKSGASGLLTALGGWPGVIIGGAGAALGILAQKHQEAAQKEAEHKAHQEALRESLDDTTGSITAQTRELQLQALEESGMRRVGTELGLSSETMAGAMTGDENAMRKANAAADAAIESTKAGNEMWQKRGDALAEVGVSYVDLANAEAGVAGAREKIRDAINGSDLSAMDKSDLRDWAIGVRDDMDDAALSAAEFRGEIGRLDDSAGEASLSEQVAALTDYADAANKAKETTTVLGDAVRKVGEDPGKISVEMNEEEYQKVRYELDDIGVNYEFDGKTLSIDMPNGAGIIDTLDQIDFKLNFRDGRIDISSNTDEEKEKLVELGLATKDEMTGEITMRSDVQDKLQELWELKAIAVDPITGELVLGDNIEVVDGKLQAVDGTKIGAALTVSDNVPEVERDKDRLKTPTSSTHTIITVYSNDAAGRAQAWEDELNGGPISATFRSDGGRIAALAAGGGVPGLATGGATHAGYRLPSTGPGTDITDGILGVSKSGTPLSWLDGGEWVTNSKSSEKYNSVLYAVNKDDAEGARRALDNLPAFKDGGKADKKSEKPKITRSEKVKRELAPYNNGSYLMGGFTGHETDCSGAVSMAVNSWNDDDLFASRMSTATEGPWLAARGFKPGRLANAMVVAWYDHGGGAYGHTASQLEDGTYIESGGNTGQGLTIGPPAGPLDGRGFTHFMSKPLGEDEDEVTEDSVKKSEEDLAKRAAESKPSIVITDADVRPEPIAAAMYHEGNDPNGILSLTRAGDYTERFGNRYKVGEDDDLVEFLLWAKGGQDETDSELARAFNPDNDPRGIRSMVEAGVFTKRFGDAFGESASGPLVKAILAARDAGGINTRRVQQWDAEYGDVETSISGIAGKVAKSLVEGVFGDVFAALGVEDDLGPLFQAGIQAAKYGVSLQSGTAYMDAGSASSASSGAAVGGMGVAARDLDRDEDDASQAEAVAAEVVKDPKVEAHVKDQILDLLNGGRGAFGFASGGMFSPMGAGRAAIVPPNTMRLIGDRTDVDEFYLPDTPDSVATGAEWARRRGLQLTIAGNQRRQMTRAFADAQAAAPVAGPTYNAHTTVNGFDRHEVTAGIRQAEKIARWEEGF